MRKFKLISLLMFAAILCGCPKKDIMPYGTSFHLSFQDALGNDLVEVLTKQAEVLNDGSYRINSASGLYTMRVVFFDGSINPGGNIELRIHKGRLLSGYPEEIDNSLHYLFFNVGHFGSIERFTIRFSFPTLFGNVGQYEFVAYCKKTKDNHYVCYRLELNNKEIEVFQNSSGTSAAAIVILD